DLVMSDSGFSGTTFRVLRIATPPDATGMTVDGLQTDSRGDFFLTLDRRAADQSGHSSDPAATGSDSWTASTILAFRTSIFSGRGGVVGGAAPTAITYGTDVFTTRPTPPSPASQPYPPAPTRAAVAACAAPAGAAGSIAFDGRYVDYAQDESAPGIIFRVDAVGCGAVSPLVLRPGDFPGGTLPALHALSYDARYLWPDGRMGAILGNAPPGSDQRVASTSVPIYAIDPVTATSVLLTSVSTAATAEDPSVGYGMCTPSATEAKK